MARGSVGGGCRACGTGYKKQHEDTYSFQYSSVIETLRNDGDTTLIVA